jgi:acetoin utilization protein AcuC
MKGALVFSPALAAYDLGAAHPLKPERFSLAVQLLRDAGLLDGPIPVIEPRPATTEELLRVHTCEYLALVREASDDPAAWRIPRAGLGTGDDPVFAGMYEGSALVCGATVTAMAEVLSGRVDRAMSIAGGLHHAHADHASGFCVMNDPAVAIAAALAEDPGMRVAYVDIDAHHGDGVQDIFYEDPRVLTVSVHESGTFLFPGTGFPDETGAGPGVGTAANLPLPPGSTDACYRLAMDDFIAPVVLAFSPDVIVAQLGADAHHDDPLTTLGLTLSGHAWLVDAIIRLANDACEGRLAATGGGGYGAFSVVPRAWASATARLAGVELPEGLPEAWRDRVERLGVRPAPTTVHEDDWEPDQATEPALLALTARTVAASRDALSASFGTYP